MTYNDENPTCDNRIGLSKQIPFHGKYMSDANCTKRCTKCGAHKSATEFSKNRCRSDGLNGWCKKCMLSANQRLRKKDPEKAASYSRKYRAEDPSKHRMAQARWRENNPERAKEVEKEWCNRNQDYLREKYANRRRRERSAEGKITRESIKFLMEAQQGKCACCKSELDRSFHVDHIIPLSTGGNNHKDNLQLLCAPCNLSKGAKHPVDFMQSRGFLL